MLKTPSTSFQIRQLDRPLEVPDKGLVCDLLWSDPDEDITGWGDNDRGVSWTFGGDVLRDILDKYGFSLIARAHQVTVITKLIIWLSYNHSHM